ncbi:MAG: hypothetical protein JWO42_3310 [Chloroflexi bacterium]|nr:hypothetical protein [Chloroflexota bacterium]
MRDFVYEMVRMVGLPAVIGVYASGPWHQWRYGPTWLSDYFRAGYGMPGAAGLSGVRNPERSGMGRAGTGVS